MSATPLRLPLKSREVEYPSSDGKPMAETGLHRSEMMYAIEALQEHFLDVPDVYVSGNLLLYYVEGDPRRSISPDVLVAKGVADAKTCRDVYKVWEEGQAPCWVLEVTSKSTRTEDLRKKMDLYRDLGVEEYFLFDPREEYLHPSLQGFRLARSRGSEYRPLPLDVDGSLVSPVLGVRLLREGQKLRLLHAGTGAAYLRTEEKSLARRQAEERASREAEARRQAEERAARLEAELARLRRGPTWSQQ
ncbi:MAG TPA: Uma2 family endonuclease [Thermoanaerobaculia bacterium]|nr:Uma2 family endonuclease [Thermoanaerobaculia bacterium]